MKKLLTGNSSIANAVVHAGVQLIAAYPITPQTSIVEKLVEFCGNGDLKADFVTVESEHSAMACLIGAATTGVRVFTATSSQGLALMHEVLHWAVGARLPIVMANVNRAMAAPWTIWCDHTDSLAQRDTGWIQFYCENCQEAFDTILQAYKISEEVNLPSMVNIDGFYLSHTVEPVDIPDFSVVESFLPYKEPEFKLNTDSQDSFSGGTTPEFFYEFRAKIQKEMDGIEARLDTIYADFCDKFGRDYNSIESFEVEDAEIVLITAGTIAGTTRSVVRKLRESGKKIGLVNIRLFRPFPSAALRKMLKGIRRIGVIDRNLSPGIGGIFYQEIKSALYSMSEAPQIFGFIAGLGGRDVVPSNILEIVEIIENNQKPESDIIWIGLKNELV
ncbi:pyruvate ferredoxin oxidoreductase [candidate division KSB1 bacterium]